MTDRTSPPKVWAVIAGGGTGGHVIPAIAIGRELAGRGHARESILFMGSRRGMEDRLVPQAGFPLERLPGRGIARRLTLDNVGAALGLVAAVVRAVAMYARRRPAVTVSVGGYASVPAVIASVLWRVPLIVAEQNAVPGLANRLAGRFAAAAAVSFAGTPLPRAVVTGNPVRPEVVAAGQARASAAGGGAADPEHDRRHDLQQAARHELGLPADAFLIAVAGGSLGARRINDAVVGLARLWAGRGGVCLYHVVGRRDFAAVSADRPPSPPGGLDYRQVEFEDRMPQLLAAADVAVQRAGASTVAELTVIGVPSILVPLPGAPGDHQTVNARRLADGGAAVLVPDAELDADRLAAELDRLAGDRPRLATMAAAARAMGRPDAAERVADLVEGHARA